MFENYNLNNSNQFEVIICNDWLQQTRLKLFTFYVNLSDLLFVDRNFHIGNHKNKVIIKSTANSMNTSMVSWVLHKIKLRYLNFWTRRGPNSMGIVLEFG